MKKGFTLIEILAALATMAILLVAFTRFFGGTLRASSTLQVRNELLSEATIAQGLIASRVKEAWFVWPKGASLELTRSGWTTQNPFDGGQTWTVGKRFLAMILPPLKDDVPCSLDRDGCFRFFAYYPLPRSYYVAHASVVETLEPDPANDARTWVLMEYRAVYRKSGQARCPVRNEQPDPNNLSYRGRKGRFLLDYLQPPTDPWDTRFNYPGLFLHSADATAVTVNLRLARAAAQRVYRVPDHEAPFSLTVRPKNVGVPVSDESPYCQ